jgi:periplasmic protein TonB
MKRSSQKSDRMDSNLVLNDSFNELVFERRNKQYGAYEIRKRYRKNVLLSGFIASAFFATAFGGYLFLAPDAHALMKPDLTEGPRVITIEDKPFRIEPKTRVETKTSQTPPAKGSDANVTPEVTMKEVPAPKLSDTVGSSTGVTGGTGTVKLDTIKPCVDCPGAGEPPIVEPPVITYSQNPPVCPTCDDFFAKNVHYPQQAKEMGIEGTVWLSFIIDTKGEVHEVSVAKSAHPSLDKEALRVAKAMPKWTPGKDDNGQPVKFLYRKAIRFVLGK